MYLAVTEDKQRIPATKDVPGYCPNCYRTLVARMGEQYVWHWGHRPNEACNYRTETTRWHYVWLQYYHKRPGWEVEVELDGFLFDAYNKDQGKVMQFFNKYSATLINDFLGKCESLKLEPNILFHSDVFKATKINKELKYFYAYHPSIIDSIKGYMEHSGFERVRFFVDFHHDSFVLSAFYNCICELIPEKKSMVLWFGKPIQIGLDTSSLKKA